MLQTFDASGGEKGNNPLLPQYSFCSQASARCLTIRLIQAFLLPISIRTLQHNGQQRVQVGKPCSPMTALQAPNTDILSTLQAHKHAAHQPFHL